MAMKINKNKNNLCVLLAKLGHGLLGPNFIDTATEPIVEGVIGRHDTVVLLVGLDDFDGVTDLGQEHASKMLDDERGEPIRDGHLGIDGQRRAAACAVGSALDRLKSEAAGEELSTRGLARRRRNLTTGVAFLAGGFHENDNHGIHLVHAIDTFASHDSFAVGQGPTEFVQGGHEELLGVLRGRVDLVRFFVTEQFEGRDPLVVQIALEEEREHVGERGVDLTLDAESVYLGVRDLAVPRLDAFFLLVVDQAPLLELELRLQRIALFTALESVLDESLLLAGEGLEVLGAALDELRVKRAYHHDVIAIQSVFHGVEDFLLVLALAGIIGRRKETSGCSLDVCRGALGLLVRRTRISLVRLRLVGRCGRGGVAEIGTGGDGRRSISVLYLLFHRFIVLVGGDGVLKRGPG